MQTHTQIPLLYMWLKVLYNYEQEEALNTANYFYSFIISFIQHILIKRLL